MQIWGTQLSAHKGFRFAAFEGASAVVMLTTDDDLASPSVDHAAMADYWAQVTAILGGIKTMKATREVFLPKHPFEQAETYEYRLQIAKMTNVFADITEDLSSRPFQKETKLGDDAPSEITDYCKDVDGSGSDLTSFARSMFHSGVNYALDWIFVDYPVVPARPEGTAARTRQDDIEQGVRPYWSHVLAQNVLEVRSKIINGRETLVYMRICEPAHDGVALRIRVMNGDGVAANWSLWEKLKNPQGGADKWTQIDAGIFTIGVIPLTPFITGKRRGKTWQFDPAMRHAGDLQIQLYRDESNLNHAKTMTAFPMISANGVKPTIVGTGANAKTVPLGTGPGVVLYAPVDGKGNAGSFDLLEPSATSLTFLQSDIDKTINNLRELGRQPLTAQSGNITVVTAGVAAMKGNSAVKTWAIEAGLTLENALKLTCLWLGIEWKEPKADLFTDFEVDGQQEQMAALQAMRDKGDLSQETLWDEAQRRGVLSPDFEPDAERDRLLDETPGDDELTGDLNPDGTPKEPGAVPPVGNLPAPQSNPKA